MGIKYFIANHYLWLAGIIVLSAALAATALKSYFAAMALLKAALAENRKLKAQVEEYQVEHTDALAHLNAANERKLKSQHIGHTKMKDEQRMRYNKTMELMAKGHLKELLSLKSAHAEEVAALKAAHKKTVEGLKGGYMYAIENQQTALEKASEALKQEYHLDIEQRRYQFETMRAQYEKFFRMLDKFETDNDVRTHETIYPILDDFQRNYIQALNNHNKKNAENAIKVASKRLQRLALDARQDLAKIKEEMNAIRLIVNSDGLEKLTALADMYDIYMKCFDKLMNEFIPSLLAQKVDKISENNHYLNEAANAIPAIKEAFINLTRGEVRAA